MGSHGFFNLLAPVNSALTKSPSRKVNRLAHSLRCIVNGGSELLWKTTGWSCESLSLAWGWWFGRGEWAGIWDGLLIRPDMSGANIVPATRVRFTSARLSLSSDQPLTVEPEDFGYDIGCLGAGQKDCGLWERDYSAIK